MVAVAALFVSLIAATSAPPGDQARLCFVRPEQNGYLNIVPVQVETVRDKRSLGGGETVCLDEAPGTYPIRLAWRWDARDPVSHSYQSAVTRVRLATGQIRRLSICPGPATPSGAPRWLLTASACPKT